MIELEAPAKLTVSLRITGVLTDGMHLIDAEMVSLDLADRLVLEDGANGVVVEGHDVGSVADNLVQRALDLVQRQARVVVHKAIAPGGGLGGGSADAAAILAWAGYDDLAGAAALGADVAFCLVGGRARVTGIGEQIEPLPFEARTYTLLTPPFGCSTPAVYRRWDEMGGPQGEADNDLEPAAVSLWPELVRYRDALGDVAGSRPRLAGSGSTWFVEGAHRGHGHVVVRTVGPRAPGRAV